MAETAFSVAYDGPALADGTMPVRELAPALLALGDIFAEASLILYPDRPPVALSIKATEEGSFLVRLILEAEGVWDQVVDIFGSDAADALANMKELIIGGGVGLFFFVRWLKGRKVKSVERSPRPGYVLIIAEDGSTLELRSEVLALRNNPNISRKARRVVAPLTHPGIEEVRFGEGNDATVIRDEDVPAFEPSDEEEPLSEQTLEMVVEIVSPTFAEENKWRLSDGQNTFFAAMEDDGFLERVSMGAESFRKGDLLRCSIRIVQTRRTDGLHTEHHVVRVVDHIPGAVQTNIYDVSSDENSSSAQSGQ
jgi:hypothetical protein